VLLQIIESHQQGLFFLVLANSLKLDDDGRHKLF
jgi:hypothetical protein